MYLSFSAGDFLHVVSRESDPDWYEACNPLRNERGLVPVKYFENVHKTVRDSDDSSRSINSTTHDSGYAEGSTPPATTTTAAPRMPANMNGMGPTANMPGHRATPSFGKSPAGIYGIVSYDFHAERPDELDAKEGEAIIVIAQSNPEWFVAKPITRLGGPGLIPVSFIEIRDMVTGRAAEDPLEAVRAAGIPRVEEWKKMAAEYKNTSIPLGTVSTTAVGTMDQAMGRMSLQQQNGSSMHSRQASIATQQQQNMFAPLRASVPRYTYADDKFHFVVECKLANNCHYDLSRIYEDFYELQINMINAFPEEAGQTPGKPRILPYMPGPVKYVTDNITEGRRANLDEYLRDLLQLPQHITHSSLVRGFFALREGDYEVDPATIDLNEHARPSDGPHRDSQASMASGQSALHQPYPGQAGQARTHQYTHSQASNNGGLHRPQPSQASASFSSQSPGPGGLAAPPPVSRQHTNVSHTTVNSTASTGPVKVKAWFDRDTCVVIRMPARGQFGFEDLRKKIVERRKLEFGEAAELEAEDLDIEYRDEKDGEYYRLEGDEDLDIAVERNEKLTLAVRAAGGPPAPS